MGFGGRLEPGPACAAGHGDAGGNRFPSTYTGALAAPPHAGDRLGCARSDGGFEGRSEEHTSELQSLMRISYAVFCLTKKKLIQTTTTAQHTQACSSYRLALTAHII